MNGELLLHSPVRVHTPPQQRRSCGASALASPCGSPRRERRAGGGRNSSPSPATAADRFIPARANDSLDLSHFKLSSPTARRRSSPSSVGEAAANVGANASQGATPTQDTTPAQEEYRAVLERTLLGKEGRLSGRVLSFSSPSPSSAEGGSALSSPSSPVAHRLLRADEYGSPRSRRHTPRRLPSSPERVLDAPDIIDDYYCNLLDWSSQNSVAVALGTSVYLWNASSGATTQLMSLGEDEGPVTSVSFCSDGSMIAVGTQTSGVQLWDVSAARYVRRLGGHSSRVGASSWNPAHPALLSTGSRDSFVLTHDHRAARNVVAVHEAHTQEVCGVRWSPDGSQLATGGNDNLLCVWDGPTSETPRYAISQHVAAVKALAWCPWQPHLLASGGGTADRCIRFWNTTTGACVSCIDTRSQVCAIQWSKHSRELVSSHGFSQNQLIVWSYPSMTKVGELTGHTSRVLHLALSPDGTTAASAAGDETLRFWRLFEPKATVTDMRAASPRSTLRRHDIRSSSVGAVHVSLPVGGMSLRPPAPVKSFGSRYLSSERTNEARCHHHVECHFLISGVRVVCTHHVDKYSKPPMTYQLFHSGLDYSRLMSCLHHAAISVPYDERGLSHLFRRNME